MKSFHKTRRFFGDESGSLLVFFVVSIVAVLGIVALSFDMGRRASTQTDMQSFADNVALAAAGELDGRADSITRATAAAQQVIVAATEALKAGASGTNAAPTFNPASDLVFYSDLPPSDTPVSFTVAALSASKYVLPAGAGFVTTIATDARYVGVRLATVDVDWMFGGIFGNANLPDEAVGAIAVAGNAGFACDFAPLMVCLPRDALGNVASLQEGQGVRVATSGNGAAWNPGQFGFLDISEIPDSVSGPCTMNNEAQRQACLLARRLTGCFESGTVDIQPGQRTGQEYAQFNMPFGVYSGSMGQHSNDSVYAMGPHSVSGLTIRPNNCNVQNNAPPTQTMAFPEDDCQVSNSCSNYPDANDPDDRFGDGNWSAGRVTYVNTNYTYVNSNGATVNGSWFDFPEANLTRYQYYLREIERAANGGIMETRYGACSSGEPWCADNDGARSGNGNGGGGNGNGGGGNGNGNGNGNGGGGGNGNGGGGGGGNGNGGGGGETTAQYTTWDDYWPDTLPASGVNPIIPDAHLRVDNGLPQCSAPTSTNADRRVVIVAGIDCPPGAYTGRQENVPVLEYYRTFQLSPARIANGGGGGPTMEIDVEIIESLGPIAGGSTSVAPSPFRQVIQLYR